MIKRRLIDLGYKEPTLAFTDDCCTDTPLLCEVWPSLDPSFVAKTEEPKYPILPAPNSISYFTDLQLADQQLASSLESHCPELVAFDMEWVPAGLSTARTRSQLANSGKVCLIILCVGALNMSVTSRHLTNVFSHSYPWA